GEAIGESIERLRTLVVLLLRIAEVRAELVERPADAVAETGESGEILVPRARVLLELEAAQPERDGRQVRVEEAGRHRDHALAGRVVGDRAVVSVGDDLRVDRLGGD